jgi:predicted dehydrogenase
LTSIFGRPQWVQSHHRNVLKLSENVDCTVTTVGYGDVVATVTAHYVVPSYNRLAIYGTEGILLDDEAGLRFKAEGAKTFEPVEAGSGEGMAEVLTAYGESLLTGKPFEVDGEEAMYAVATCEGAIRSAADGGRKVDIEKLIAGERR